MNQHFRCSQIRHSCGDLRLLTALTELRMTALESFKDLEVVGGLTSLRRLALGLVIPPGSDRLFLTGLLCNAGRSDSKWHLARGRSRICSDINALS